ncbi:MAG: DUF3482 domain-containing protein [Pseudomonadota bacterium]
MESETTILAGSDIRIPEFAVLGHPNEGKSSVVSTLTENDQIRISPIPGETTRSAAYTVKIDGQEIIRFVDTPGFQVPQQTLAWFKAHDGKSGNLVEQFIQTFENDPFYADECELFGPVARGAGIIYVVDGSRPVREDDLAEIEILRRTGRPRMAVINSKSDQKNYSADWKHEFLKNFNAIRVFNSNTADFNERIAMLESLKSIDQEWEGTLSKVIEVFESDWHKRKRMVCADMAQMLENCLSYSVSEPISSNSDVSMAKEQLNQTYEAHIKKFEQQMFRKIRALFKHHLFEYQLPEYSILVHDLFSKQTWELLGLTTGQLVGAGAVVGGGLGAVLDGATLGSSFGVFIAVGSLIGAGSALWGGKKIAREKRAGLRLGGNRLTVGPNRNIQFLYVLLDRVLIYTAHMMNRPHGRRDLKHVESSVDISGNGGGDAGKKGYTTHFTMAQKRVSARFFKVASRRLFSGDKLARQDFQNLLESLIDGISKGSVG